MTQLCEADLTALLKPTSNGDMITPEQRRRLLACGLDELEREASELERALVHVLNHLRKMQGKRPVIVPKG